MIAAALGELIRLLVRLVFLVTENLFYLLSAPLSTSCAISASPLDIPLYHAVHNCCFGTSFLTLGFPISGPVR
jgi:hypothetical protein